MCFQQPLGPKKVILLLSQQLSQDLVDPCELLPEVCRARYYQEKRAKNICYSENRCFLKSLFLSTS